MTATLTLDTRRRRVRAAAGLAIGSLAAAAWLTIWLWQSSAYGRYLDHDGLADSGLDGGPLVAVFLAGWILMLSAMMLPTTWSLVSLFTGVVARRPDRIAVLSSLVAGYLAAWTAAAAVAFIGDAALHGLAARVTWIGDHPWAVPAAVVALAGAYQFSALKNRCLDKCRSPRMMIFASWRGIRPVAEAFSLGARHGRFCIGCCWALMALMFAVGLGSLGWMLALGAVMAIEKNLAWGARLTAPVGAVLLLAAAAVAGAGMT